MSRISGPRCMNQVADYTAASIASTSLKHATCHRVA
ncbi:hypothetical protein FHW67_003194 [Herbaspirillum sp. Sphag1AN]|nr:hypothetical protein [Herbaspirillum sp. Sphag1AN]MBB3247085.1 hypothetical protein [Herbaspirillum sp. Sphag64]